MRNSYLYSADLFYGFNAFVVLRVTTEHQILMYNAVEYHIHIHKQHLHKKHTSLALCHSVKCIYAQI